MSLSCVFFHVPFGVHLRLPRSPRESILLFSFLLHCALAVLVVSQSRPCFLLVVTFHLHIPMSEGDIFVFFNLCFLSFRSISLMHPCLFFGCLEACMWKAHRMGVGLGPNEFSMFGILPSIMVAGISCTK